METARETVEKPCLSVGRRLVGFEIRKAAGKVRAKSLRIVKLETGNHSPRQAVAAQHACKCFKRDGRGKNRCRNLDIGAIQVERGDRRGAKLNAARRFVLIWRDDAIEDTGYEQRPFNRGNKPASPPDYAPKLAQRSGRELDRARPSGRRRT